MSRWLHLESNAVGLDTDTILNMKLDGIKEQLVTMQRQHPATPHEDTNTTLGLGEAHILPQSLESTENADDGFQESSKELNSENEYFQEALKECVQSAHEFVSSTRTVIESRASAAGSTTGLGLASEAGQNFATERRLDIEEWIAVPLHTETNSRDRIGLGYSEPSSLSRAERRFLEVCEEIEQLGRDGKNDKAAVIGMSYLQELWDHYSSRLREHYTSDSYQVTYMTEEMHGQQLRKNILESQGRGFIGPERSSTGTYSILHFLAHIGCSAEFRLSLIRTNIDPNVRDHVRKTPLIRAAHMGHKSIVACLLDLTDIAVNTPDSQGCTALDYATLNNDTDTVELFLKHLEREPVRDDHYLSRPFQLAARNGRLSVMKLLVTRPELDINHRGEDQETALHSAIIKDQFAIVQFLLKQPDIDIEKTAWTEHTPLLFAARYSKYSILHLLLDRQDINVNSCTSQGRTPLSYIAARGSKEIAGRLLQKGGDPDIPDQLRNIPIVLAASRCLLLRNRALRYPLEKREPEKHFELVEEFLNFYGIKKPALPIMHRYVDLCTQYIEQKSAGTNSLADLDLGPQWFEKVSSSHIHMEGEQTPSRITPATQPEIGSPELSDYESHDDSISITSTVLSEQKDEYPVEAILAEKKIKDITKYLVKWKGYPEDRCTWETRSTFQGDKESIFHDWEIQKMRVSRGLAKPFDVPAFEKGVDVRLEGVQQRKFRRRAKRRQVPEINTDPSLSESMQNLKFGERHQETEIGHANPTMSSIDQDSLSLPCCWHFLLDFHPRVPTENLFSMKKILDDHCFELQIKDIVPTSQITAVTSEYEASIALYLEDDPTRLHNPPKAIMAMAMLWQRPNPTLVLGPSHSGKSKFIWLTCGNVQRRIKATANGEGIALNATQLLTSDPQFIITGTWLNGIYCPIVEIRYKSPNFFTAQALEFFARRFAIDLKMIICTLPFPPQELWEYTGGLGGLSVFQVIRDLQLLNTRRISVTYVTVGGPDWIDAKSYSIKRLGNISNSYEKTIQLPDDKSPDLEKLEVSRCSDSADAIAIFTGSSEIPKLGV